MRRETQPDGAGKLSRRADTTQPGKEQLDSLTGILKRDAAEARIASILDRRQGGALFLCDVNQLRKINDQFGHLAGDECLRQVAQILTYMIAPEDILGRWGGDEFLVYKPDCRDEQQAREICERIKNRFGVNRRKEKGNVFCNVTITWTMWQAGDTSRKLIERVCTEQKRYRETLYIENEQPGGGKNRDPYAIDVRRVRRDLSEQIKIPGAYCQDYETFKGIYRFLERGLIRSGQEACVILITVVGEQGESLHPYEKDKMMGHLGEHIGATLRIGDVYTRYSSSQYLVLVIDTTEGQADMIAERIKERFFADSRGNDVLVHHCYKLQPTRFGEQQG